MKLPQILTLTTATLLFSLTPTLLTENKIFYSSVMAQTTETEAKQAEADRLLNQGIEQYKISEYQFAIESLQKALKLYQEIGDLSSISQSLHNLGIVYRSLGEYSQAIDYFQQSLAIKEEIDNRQGIADSLISLGIVYYKLQKYEQEIDYLNQSLAINQDIGNKPMVANTLLLLGDAHYTLEQYEKAIDYHQQSLVIFEDIATTEGTQSARQDVADCLMSLGNIYYHLEEYEKVLDYFQQSLVIFEEIRDRSGMAYSLGALGVAYKNLDEDKKAIDYLSQSLAIFEEIGEKSRIARTSYDLAIVYLRFGEDEKATDSFQKSLKIDDNTIYSTNSSLEGVAGETYLIELISDNFDGYLFLLDPEGNLIAMDDSSGGENYAHIIITLPKTGTYILAYNNDGIRSGVLTISRTVPATYNEEQYQADQLRHRAEYAFDNGDFEIALKLYQEALGIYEQLDQPNNRYGMVQCLMGVGNVYFILGEYKKAHDYFQQSLIFYQKIGDRIGVAYSLANLGNNYQDLAKYKKAFDYLNQSLAIFKEVDEDSVEFKASYLNSLGILYDSLGQYEKAIDYYQQSLAIFEEIGEKSGIADSLNNLGKVYSSLGKYNKALDYHQQSLAIKKEIGNIYKVSNSLLNLGNVYYSLGEYSKAREYFQQSLAIKKEIGDRSGVSNSFLSLGNVYYSLGEYSKAIDSFQQSLAIQQEIGDRSGEALTYNNLALLLQKQNQPSTAIIFYKESVNLYEQIRHDIEGLPPEQQKSYLSTIEHTYRNLADLLLKQDRILEAQRVLDLLKVQELDDYLRGVRGTENSKQGIPNLPPEQQINDGLNSILAQAITINQEYDKLITLRNQQGELREVQQQKLIELGKEKQQIIREFNDFIESEEVENLIAQLTPLARKSDFASELDNLTNLSDNLRALNQNAVLIYPLILEDRIEMIITTYTSAPVRHTVKVNKQELTATISEYRQQLKDPNSNPKNNANKLYNWLIKPLEKDLIAVDAKTIIYAPDGILRYIPLSTLHDGKQWLIEKYAVNHITATSLTDLNTQPQPEINLLAGAYANVSDTVNLAEENFDFQALPFTAIEVANLAKTIPKTKTVIDRDFNVDLIPTFDAYTVIHLATHGALVIGKPEQSFILFGDGKPVTLIDMKSWSFRNIDLVVLSACETALGGNFGSGIEILGLGYMMEKAGARASIASLWTVDDGGTQTLMSAFYQILAQGNITKAQALQQAQISLINSQNNQVYITNRAGVELTFKPDAKMTLKSSLSHPYYWSPFILIGNGL